MRILSTSPTAWPSRSSIAFHNCRISRSARAARRFVTKAKDIDAEKIGNELGVDAVMSGRLTQRGDNLTISVDLIDVKNKKTLWGEQFERKMSDLLATPT